MTNGEAITELHMLQCRFHQIRKSDAAWEAIEMAKDALRAREKSKDDLVKHGKWIRYEDTQEHTVKYICPYCFDYTAFREDPGDYTVRGNYIYCRKCGAKMDGGNEDNG